MKLIDVLVKQCNGEIKKGTKLIVDFSYEQDSPEIYVYDGESFIDESDDYHWLEDYGARTETLNTEVKLIEPKLYYCKMPNSDSVPGVYKDLINFTSFRNIKSYTVTRFLFTQEEIESLDILAPYRNFEWSEYHESMDS